MRKSKKLIPVILSSALALSLTANTTISASTYNISSTLSTFGQFTGSQLLSNSFTNNALTGISISKNSVLRNYQQDSDNLVIDNSKWNYDETNDVYWQLNINYCTNPESTTYETMGIYVPGAYMTGTENEDGTYTCTMNADGKVADYTAETAPIVFPVNTAGYSAQASPTSYKYSQISDYLESGFIYVCAGMRGRSNGYDEDGNLTYSGGAPWGVTDLKAAVRYYRFNQSTLPGNTNSIFTFGHSGGGAQSALMGATGDSSLYYKYLTSIGAAMYDQNGKYISDAINGAMCWCPITSLDYADEAYEWNMGQYSDDGTRSDDTWTSALSDDMAASFATYINKLGLTDESGKRLTLQKTSDGIYTAGSYYNYLLSVIEDSLNNFLSNTTFPYTESSGHTMGDGGFGGFSDETGGENVPAGGMDFDTSGSEGMSAGDNSSSNATTYDSVQDYIDSLNSDEEWITYDADTNTASISSIEAFVTHCKNASKNVCAFDDLDLGQAENMLFGNDSSDALHFDSVITKLLNKNASKYAEYEDYISTYAEEYKEDMTATDKFGTSSQMRQNMYNPMYYLSNYYSGYKTSNVASYWRINTGIDQGDTALTVETNLALALENYKGVKDVDFTTVWGQGHTTAERTGDSTANFIEWVNDCLE